ncbi:MAG: rhomboid family intramembrane serine protease [Oligoflexales bacterium]
MEHRHTPITSDHDTPDKPRIPGWLEQKPKTKDINPSLLIYFLCILCTGFAHHSAVPAGFWVSNESIFTKHEYWRLLSALLVHADWGHLLANSPLLLIFSWYLRTYFGLIMFPLVSLFAGGLTNLITVFYYPEAVRLVGASGMVYAMVAMWLTLYTTYETRFSKLARMMRVLGFALVLMAPTTFKPETSYLAHGVGFLVGGALALISIPFLKTPKQLPQSLWTQEQKNTYSNQEMEANLEDKH